MKIKLIKSYIGATPKQRGTLKALGLKRLHQVKEIAPNADMKTVKGMVFAVSHMVEVIE
jgi:large subunit ribosomal protein L30